MPVGFAVPAGDLGFSVGVFSVTAVSCLAVLVLRRAVRRLGLRATQLRRAGKLRLAQQRSHAWRARAQVLGCELGGPALSRYGSAGFFVFLWCAAPCIHSRCVARCAICASSWLRKSTTQAARAADCTARLCRFFAV